MKKILALTLALLLAGIIGLANSDSLTQAAANRRQGVNSISEFWSKFSAAVIKGDKVAVASFTRFPVSMPYGMAAVKNKVQLNKRYRTVFNGEADAAKCFATARTETDPANPRVFSVACANAAGHEVVIYSFTRTASGWKFTGLDNLNE